MAREKIIHESTKGLIHYQVVDTIYNNRPARVLFTENRLAAESGIALDKKDELLFDYNERFMEIIRGLKPKRVLLLGGGAFTLPRAINKEYPNIHLDIVELDPELYKISKKYFGFKPKVNTFVHITDALDFLKTSKTIYDLILVDLFLNNIIPPTLRDKKFTKTIKKVLDSDGLVAMNVIATYYGQRSLYLNNLVSAYSSSFKDVQLFPADNQQSLWISQNFIITGQQKPNDLQPYLRFKSLKAPNNTWRQWIIN
jgi:spermidine synthase